ncbi:ASST-domain-containing protein [Xylariaceae sp. FL0016]|nr:ASST-domain-containing protein [Xylariaceae sp. FL0016]
MRLTSIFQFVAAGLFTIRASADSSAYINDKKYDSGSYGNHPSQQFRSAAELEAPVVNILQWDESCASSRYTLLTPRGGGTRKAQATILDDHGNLVWTTGWENQQIYNLMVQKYKGEDYLTFWAGNDAVGGHGAGTIHMLDKHYDHFKEIRAADGLDADLHDFRITDAGTALITVYEIVQMDMSSMGKYHYGPVWDCIVQEIDLETGKAVFEWRATDHWSLTDSFKDIGGDGEPGRAYDFFHLNSIEKDARGNYLVSSRYTKALTYINGTDGEVLWILGGKRNMFRDLSGGRATAIAYQHDARQTLASADDDDAGGNATVTVTVFDNGVEDGHPTAADTRGLKVRLDEAALTATVVAEYLNPHRVRGVSQGSFQPLDHNGHVLLGYGNTAAYTEFDARDGRPLCDVHFAPESRFGTGDVQSYRVYKYAWRGWPRTRPAAVVGHDGYKRWSVYASWNGATEVARWVLQGAEAMGAPEAGWRDLEIRTKVRFETGFELQTTYPPALRVVAMDAAGQQLGISQPLDGNMAVYGPQPGQPLGRRRRLDGFISGVILRHAIAGDAVAGAHNGLDELANAPVSLLDYTR